MVGAVRPAVAAARRRRRRRRLPDRARMSAAARRPRSPPPSRGPRGARGRHRDLRGRSRSATPRASAAASRSAGCRAAADAAPADADTIFDLGLADQGPRPRRCSRCASRTPAAARRPIASGAGGRRGTARTATTTTLADLLAHASGLAAHRCLYRGPARRRRLRRRDLPDAARRAASRTPRSTAISGSSSSASSSSASATPASPRRSRRCCAALTDAPLAYRPPAAWRPRTASTGLGGVAAARTDRRGERREHAGRWTAWPRMPACSARRRAVGDVGRAVLRALRGTAVDGLASPATVRRFATRRTDVPGTTRALGWDTMKATSSCGRFMSPTRHRPHRLHRHVAVDRRRARRLRRAAHQPRRHRGQR